MTQPLISVIIPAFDAEPYLEASIRSVLSQTYENIELIVVDDGSYTPCKKLCDQFKQVRYVRQDNQGPAGAMNTGIEISQGQLIAFHDADDLCMQTRIATQCEALIKHQSLDFVVTKLENFLEKEGVMPNWFHSENKLKDRMGFISTALIRREVFDEVGVFNRDYLIGEDIDWLLRARNTNMKSVTIPEVLVHRRIHDKNLCANIALAHDNLIKILHSDIKRRRQKDKEI